MIWKRKDNNLKICKSFSVKNHPQCWMLKWKNFHLRFHYFLFFIVRNEIQWNTNLPRLISSSVEFDHLNRVGLDGIKPWLYFHKSSNAEIDLRVPRVCPTFSYFYFGPHCKIHGVGPARLWSVEPTPSRFSSNNQLILFSSMGLSPKNPHSLLEIVICCHAFLRTSSNSG